MKFIQRKECTFNKSNLIHFQMIFQSKEQKMISYSQLPKNWKVNQHSVIVIQAIVVAKIIQNFTKSHSLASKNQRTKSLKIQLPKMVRFLTQPQKNQQKV